MIPTCGYLRKQKAVMKRYLFENSMMSFSFYVSVFLNIEIDISDVFVVHVFYNTSLLRNIPNIKVISVAFGETVITHCRYGCVCFIVLLHNNSKLYKVKYK